MYVISHHTTRSWSVNHDHASWYMDMCDDTASCFIKRHHVAWHLSVNKHMSIFYNTRPWNIMQNRVPWSAIHVSWYTIMLRTWYTRFMITHNGTWSAWMGVFGWMDGSRAWIKPMCAMLNNVWTTLVIWAGNHILLQFGAEYLYHFLLRVTHDHMCRCMMVNHDTWSCGMSCDHVSGYMVMHHGTCPGIIIHDHMSWYMIMYQDL